MRLSLPASYCILSLSLQAAILPEAKPEQVGMSTQRLKRLSAVMHGYAERGDVAGTVTLVARRGQIVHFEADGVMDVGTRQPMRRDTIFRLASMTKPITSVAVMMLSEEGRFQLTDPISKFIPEFKNPQVMVTNFPGSSRAGWKLVPADREITIQDLLTHTAGLATATSTLLRPEVEKFQNEGSPNETVGDYTKRLAKLPLHFQPGTAWEYGPATNVLGYLVEVVSGQPLDRFFAERIFRPLEMKDTFFYVPDDKLNRLASVHEAVQPSGVRVMKPAREMRGSQVFFAGAGGLSSTAEDYWRFCQMLLNGGSSHGTQLLSRKSIELMTANHIGNLPLWPDLAGYRFGLGFRVLEGLGKSAAQGSVGSYGWGGAYGTYFFIDPKEELIGILMLQMRSSSHLNIRPDTITIATQAIIQ